MTSYVARTLLTATRQSVASIACRSYTTAPSAGLPNLSSVLFRIRPLVAATSFPYIRRLAPAVSTRGFSTRQTTSSLNDPNPNWSNRPPKETILLDGCDFEHWLVVMEKPEGDPTRDEIIDSYIKTLAMVVGSEEEARMKIYSVSTRHYFAFGALVSEELSYKIKELPRVRWVLPDSYLDVKNKDYGGEPFINGQAVPYDPKYHEEWVRNNARANERNRRNDRPRNFDRSRNFERRRDNTQMGNQSPGAGPGGNFGGQPNMNPPPRPNAGPVPPPNMGVQSNYGGGMPPQAPGNYPHGQGPNTGGGAPYPPPPGTGPQGYSPNMGPQGYAQNSGPPQGYAQNTGPPQGYAPNSGPPQGYSPNAVGGGNSYQNQQPLPPPNSFNPNQGPGSYGPNRGYGTGQAGYAPNPGQQNYGPNMGGPGQAPQAFDNPENVPGRDY
ncbi:multiple organellar RNA editing factor 8, chloroplastic/mitochondrial [Andrographis paniculata]|uniref:multiple organellar RNA editing factor 8, chloroplastic/mitochondrial n=1 Tax=Andrographis paniculata TaxID=175694 RepID=UPI0021E88558|nr:multiple organellar RNA editing factor 8, chloroplastic/mitochondrial [Andrographis paniculata]